MVKGKNANRPSVSFNDTLGLFSFSDLDQIWQFAGQKKSPRAKESRRRVKFEGSWLLVLGLFRFGESRIEGLI